MFTERSESEVCGRTRDVERREMDRDMNYLHPDDGPVSIGAESHKWYHEA